MSSEVLLDECELQHGQEVVCGFLKSCGDSAAVFEPADAALNGVSAMVGQSVEGFIRNGTRQTTTRNHGDNVACVQPVADSRKIVSFVCRQTLGTSTSTSEGRAGVSCLDHVQGLGFVSLPRCYLDGEGNSMAVTDQVELRAPATS